MSLRSGGLNDDGLPKIHLALYETIWMNGFNTKWR